MRARKLGGLSKTLGSRQTSIIEYLWRHGPQSVSELHQGLRARDEVAYTTIFTELTRMRGKGLVAKSNDGDSHLTVRYRAAVTREQLIASVVADTLGGLIAAHGPAAVHGFVDAVGDDPAALRELRRLLDGRSRKQR